MRVGISAMPSVGDKIEVGQIISVVHAATIDTANDATNRMLAAITISDQTATQRNPIIAD